MKAQMRLLVTGHVGPFQLERDVLAEALLDRWRGTRVTLPYRDEAGRLQHCELDGDTLKLAGDGPARMLVGDVEIDEEAHEEAPPRAAAMDVVGAEIERAFKNATVIVDS